jgi:hypothetical protein
VNEKQCKQRFIETVVLSTFSLSGNRRGEETKFLSRDLGGIMAATATLNHCKQDYELITVHVSIENGHPVVDASPLIVWPGSDIKWECQVAGDMCVSFNASAYPMAMCQFINQPGTPPQKATLGPFPIVGPRTMGCTVFPYTIGWRQSATEKWAFTDPVIIVDTPGGVGSSPWDGQ